MQHTVCDLWHTVSFVPCSKTSLDFTLYKCQPICSHTHADDNFTVESPKGLLVGPLSFRSSAPGKSSSHQSRDIWRSLDRRAGEWESREVCYVFLLSNLIFSTTQSNFFLFFIQCARSEHESASQSINKTLLTLFTDVFLSSVAGLESALPLLTGLLYVKMAAGVCVCVCRCLL